MSSIKKKFKWSRKGVSEIIGNILILGITVTLFSSIMYFVASMPPPQENAYADFSTDSRWVHDSLITVNLTHIGGQELKNSTTLIVLTFNGIQYIQRITDSSPSIGTTWVTGETWRYSLPLLLGENPYGTLNVMVIDTAKNSMVWNGNIAGGTVGAGVKPIISARGMTPSPTYSGDLVYIFATVTDPDGDLNTSAVFADLSSLGLASHVRMATSTGDSVFKTGPWTADISWNGKTVVINATDLNHHTETGLLTLTVYQKQGGGGGNQYGPFYNYSHYLINGTYPPDVTGGEAGSSVGTTFYYIRNATTLAITKNFNPGGRVLIEVYSNSLSNLALGNSFSLIHPITGDEIYPQTKLVDAFQYGGIYGTFNRYVYNFSAPSDSYAYPLTMKFKDSTGVAVSVSDTITINNVGYPKLETYKLVGTNLIKTSNFNHTDTVYLRIVTRDVDRNSNTVYLSNLEIADYSGRYIVNKVPPAYANPPAYSAPVSSLYKTSGASATPMGEGTNTGVYTVYIVLKEAYQGWWLPNKNTYTLSILQVKDTGSGGTTAEIYNLLNTQINVTAPLSTTDLVATVGSGSFTWSASGSSWENSQVAWYAGGEQWDETVIDNNPNQGPIGIAIADLTGEGRNDVVIASQDPSYANLVWYENLKPDGSQWSSGRAISMPFDADPGTNASGGTSTGNGDEDTTVWATRDTPADFVPSNGGTSYICTNELCGALSVIDLNGDGLGDVVASYMHVVVYSTATSQGAADASNSWGMYFNRGVYVFWNDGRWTRTTLYSTMDWLGANKANDNTNPAAMDIATGDFDRDGYPDIVAVYENGATKVWLNQWGKATGDISSHETTAFSTAASLRTVPSITPASENSNPWDHIEYIPRVRVADMNLDGYPDIIRTSTAGKNVYVIYTVPGSPDEVLSTASYEYPVSATVGASRIVGPPEQLTERYLNFTPIWVLPQQQGVGDTTGNPGNPPTALQYNDSVAYNVGHTYTLWTTYWNAPSTYTGDTAAQVKIVVKYNVDSGYNGNGKLQWSFDGVTFYDTTIQPKSTDTSPSWYYATFMLPKTVNSYDLVNNLDLRFTNNAAATATVHFDFINLNVTFVQTRELGWVWQIPNALKAYHVLTFTGHRSGVSAETFRLAYSVDNVTWLNLTDITWTSDSTYMVNLTYTPSSWYWVRAVDSIRDSTDNINDTLYATTMRIRHYALTVSWDAAHTIKVTSAAAPEYITAIAVGDVGKLGGDHKPDGIPDIVFTTAMVGAGNDLKTLFIMTQDTVGAFNTRPVYTTQMSIMCSNAAQYDTKAVELGDNDGDGDLDIIVVVGSPPGVTPGTGPTMWSYMNNQQYSTGSSAWQFGESYVNVLATKGESAINVKEGNIDLTILLPFLGVLGVVAAEAVVERKSRKGKK